MRSESIAAVIEIGCCLAAQLAAFMGMLLIGSACHKLFGFARARRVMQSFAGIPTEFAPIAVVLVASTELLAGLLLWTASYRGAGALLAGLAWGGYLALILRRMAQGRNDLDCGCSFAGTHAPLGALHVVRNVVLIGLAVGVGLARAPRAIGEGLQSFQVLPALALLALYAALDQLMVLGRLHRGELR